MIASGADGHPLYAPYPLSVAVPAMAIEHLMLFGFVEALVTALIIKYLQKADQSLLTIYGGAR
jgi:cobalt/nickel transport system permease protein